MQVRHDDWMGWDWAARFSFFFCMAWRLCMSFVLQSTSKLSALLSISLSLSKIITTIISQPLNILSHNLSTVTSFHSVAELIAHIHNNSHEPPHLVVCDVRFYSFFFTKSYLKKTKNSHLLFATTTTKIKGTNEQTHTTTFFRRIILVHQQPPRLKTTIPPQTRETTTTKIITLPPRVTSCARQPPRAPSSC